MMNSSLSGNSARVGLFPLPIHAGDVPARHPSKTTTTVVFVSANSDEKEVELEMPLESIDDGVSQLIGGAFESTEIWEKNGHFLFVHHSSHCVNKNIRATLLLGGSSTISGNAVLSCIHDFKCCDFSMADYLECFGVAKATLFSVQPQLSALGPSPSSAPSALDFKDPELFSQHAAQGKFVFENQGPFSFNLDASSMQTTTNIKSEPMAYSERSDSPPPPRTGPLASQVSTITFMSPMSLQPPPSNHITGKREGRSRSPHKSRSGSRSRSASGSRSRSSFIYHDYTPPQMANAKDGETAANPESSITGKNERISPPSSPTGLSPRARNAANKRKQPVKQTSSAFVYHDYTPSAGGGTFKAPGFIYHQYSPPDADLSNAGMGQPLEANVKMQWWNNDVNGESATEKDAVVALSQQAVREAMAQKEGGGIHPRRESRSSSGISIVVDAPGEGQARLGSLLNPDSLPHMSRVEERRGSLGSGGSSVGSVEAAIGSFALADPSSVCTFADNVVVRLEGKSNPIGVVEVSSMQTLDVVRQLLVEEVDGLPAHFVFLYQGNIPVGRKQEARRTVASIGDTLCLREVTPSESSPA